MPFLKAYNSDNNTNFVEYAEAFVPLEAIYSLKIDNLEDLQEKSKVGISNDSSNRDLALRIFEENIL